MTNQANTLTLNFANDLGYSSIKGSINDQALRVPSLIAIQRPQNIAKPVTFDQVADQDHYFAHLLKHMDVSISSPAVKLSGRFFVGERAVTEGISTRAFDVNDFTGKSDSDLSLILTLSTLANFAVKQAYDQSLDLTQQLDVTVNMATALPITEGQRSQATENYARRYFNGPHIVTVQNFAQPIVVKLTFNRVYVGLEGELAQIAINNAPTLQPKLAQALMADFGAHYPDFKDQVDAQALTGLQNVLGIDVGEGTTDYPVIVNGHANPNASTSLNAGYGTALQEAVGLLQQAGMNIRTRGELNRFLSQQVSPLAKARQDFAREKVYDQLTDLADQIIDTVSETLAHANADLDVVYLYGGGSTPLLTATDIRDRLMAKLRGFAGGFDIPVVCVPENFADQLNLDGLQAVLSAELGFTTKDLK